MFTVSLLAASRLITLLLSAVLIFETMWLPVGFGYVANSALPVDQILFVGDVMLARHVETLQLQHGLDYPFSGLQFSSITHGAPSAVVANFEGALAMDHRQTPDYQMRFSVATSVLSVLQRNGFTHFSLANNHSLDQGYENYLFTKQSLARSGTVALGGEHNLAEVSLVTLSAKTIALVAIDLVSRQTDFAALDTLMTSLEQISDLQIAYLHWGEEYQSVHSQGQEGAAKSLISIGFDVLIGAHPHVVQDVAIIDGVPVFYSLGNYIFDQYFSDTVTEGLLLQMKLVDNTLQFSLYPVETRTATAQPRLYTEPGRNVFLADLASRSQPALREQLLKGELSITVASSTKQVTIE